MTTPADNVGASVGSF